MKCFNRVFLMGYLGTQPEILTSKNSTPFTRLNVATRRSYKSTDGAKAERTDWHNVHVWGQLAETCAQYLSKGSFVFIEGHLAPYETTDKQDGRINRKTTIHAIEVKFLNLKKPLEPAS